MLLAGISFMKIEIKIYELVPIKGSGINWHSKKSVAGITDRMFLGKLLPFKFIKEMAT